MRFRRARFTEDGERDSAEARAERQSLSAGIENYADKQVIAQAGREMAQPAEVLCSDSGSGLDFAADHVPATVLQGEVDFDVSLVW